MGPWRCFKSWLKRTVVRIVLRIAHTRIVRLVRKAVQASAVPVAITGGGAIIGAGVASAIVFPLGYGALIGAVIAVAGIVVSRQYAKYTKARTVRQKMKLNYTVWSKKGKSRARRGYVVEASSSAGRF